MKINRSFAYAFMVTAFLAAPFWVSSACEEQENDLQEKHLTLPPAYSFIPRELGSFKFKRYYGFLPSSDHAKEVWSYVNTTYHALWHQGKQAFKPLNEAVPLPASADLTVYASIFDQGDLGSCTANSGAQCALVLKTLELIKAEPNLSLAQVKAQVKPFSRLYFYYQERAHMGRGYISQDSGASIADAFWTFHNKGAPWETDWPYVTTKFAQKPPAIADTHAYFNKDASNMGVEYITPGDVDAVKRALSQGYPVQMGFSVYDSFESSYASSTGDVPVPDVDNEQLLGGHAVAILGYDENFFYLANSWGTGWGLKRHNQGGFFRVPHEFIARDDITSELWRLTQISIADVTIQK